MNFDQPPDASPEVELSSLHGCGKSGSIFRVGVVQHEGFVVEGASWSPKLRDPIVPFRGGFVTSVELAAQAFDAQFRGKALDFYPARVDVEPPLKLVDDQDNLLVFPRVFDGLVHPAPPELQVLRVRKAGEKFAVTRVNDLCPVGCSRYGFKGRLVLSSLG
jgi:hypothetical protein